MEEQVQVEVSSTKPFLIGVAIVVLICLLGLAALTGVFDGKGESEVGSSMDFLTSAPTATPIPTLEIPTIVVLDTPVTLQPFMAVEIPPSETPIPEFEVLWGQYGHRIYPGCAKGDIQSTLVDQIDSGVVLREYGIRYGDNSVWYYLFRDRVFVCPINGGQEYFFFLREQVRRFVADGQGGYMEVDVPYTLNEVYSFRVGGSGSKDKAMLVRWKPVQSYSGGYFIAIYLPK